MRAQRDADATWPVSMTIAAGGTRQNPHTRFQPPAAGLSGGSQHIEVDCTEGLD